MKVNEYQRKSYLLRINFIISCQLIKKNLDHAPASLGPTECKLLDNVDISKYTRYESCWYFTF